jgi:predicted RNase H-like HicB family nuclease
MVSPALSFDIELDEENGIMSSSSDFGILVCAETRSALEDEIEEALRMLWIEYAQENDDALAPKALELAKELRKRISENLS